MKKREIFLLIILFVGIYAFIFVKFIWGGAIPRIETVKASIENVKSEKAKLDEDKENIEKFKNSLSIKTVQNDRIDEYLMSDASSADSIDYLDKLTKLFEKTLRSIRFENPVKKEVLIEEGQKPKAVSTSGDNDDNTNISVSNSTSQKNASNTYYEFRFSFTADMTYDEVMDLVSFIEGGSRKVKISKFNIVPSAEKTAIISASQNNSSSNNAGGQGNDNNSEGNESIAGVFTVEMEINLYSKDMGSINSIYNYTKNNSNRFITSDGDVIVPVINIDSNKTTPDGVVSYSDGGNKSSGVTGTKERKARDIEMRLDSFFAAGPNFSVYGWGGYSNNIVRFKTKDVTKVEIDFKKETYDAKVTRYDNEVKKLHGSFSSEEPHIVIVSNFPMNIDENKNLGIDLRISNQSGRTINISLTDKNDVVRITDRNGVVIRGYSQSENVKIL
jgi:ABC-type transporter MlaC component